MPSLRVLFVRLFPKLLGSSNTSKNNYYGGGSQNRVGPRVTIGNPKDFTRMPADSKSIMFSQSYDVERDDETYLVPMNKMPGGNSANGRSS
jgi:hypothetical protein